MPGTEVLALLCGLCSAIAWGAGDFSGGLATKRGNVLLVVLWSQLAGALVLVALALALTDDFPRYPYLLYGAAAGIAGVFGLAALYRGLALGRMGVVAPISAVTAAVIPIAFAAYSEGLPDVAQLLGFGLATLSILALSYSRGTTRIQALELGHAVVAGLGFGLFFIFIDRVSSQSVLWPLVAARGASIPCLLLLVHLRGEFRWPAKNQIGLLALIGLFDAAGNTFFALATRMGRLDIAAILSSLYPAATVMLAWVILKEHLTRTQWTGVVIAAASLVLISL
ncbi:MAG: DMT family transporter [Desulfobacterales bacterium]